MTPFDIWKAFSVGDGTCLDEMLSEVLPSGISAVGADASVVVLNDGGKWILKSFSGADPSGRPLNAEEAALAEQLARTGKGLVIEDVAGEAFGRDILLQHSIRAAIILPLRAASEVVGFLVFTYSKGPRKFAPEEMDFATKLSTAFSHAVGNDHVLKAAREERLLLLTVMDNAPAGIAVVDGKDLKVKWCNKAYRDQLDEPYGGVDVHGLPLKEFIPHFEGSRLETLFSGVVKSGKPHTESQFELKGTSRGTTFWRFSMLPFGGDGDEPDVLLLMIETTEQVKAMRGIAQLLKREEDERLRLRVILDNLPVGVVVTDAKGGFIEVNRMFDKIWGGRVPLCTTIKDYSTFSGRWSDSNEALRPEDWALARAVTKGEEVLGDVVDIRRFDGMDAAVLNSAAPIKNGDGKIIGAVQVTQDLTDRRLMETELETARSVLEAVIDQMPAGIIVADAPNGRHVFGNIELESMFGRSPSPSGGIPDYYQWQTMHPNGVPIKPEERPIVRSIQKGEVIKGMELMLRKADGSLAALSVNSAPIRNKMGKITGGVAVNVDITDRKKIERDLAEHAKELERSNAELEQFAYVVSHDLKEPLRVISGYMSLLQKRYSGKLDEEAMRFIEASINGAGRLDRLIDDMLAYSRIGSKGKPFLLTDFEHALRSSIDGLRETIEESGAVITHDPLPTTVADESQMMEVFQNLISNAIKYRSPAQPWIHISSELRGTEWVFSVTDNGIGVPKEHQEKIWRMFYRVHSKQARPGTGMGLSICKKIVERHGGRIWMEDNPAGGSVFKFAIPVKSSEPGQQAEPKPPEKPGQ